MTYYFIELTNGDKLLTECTPTNYVRLLRHKLVKKMIKVSKKWFDQVYQENKHLHVVSREKVNQIKWN